MVKAMGRLAGALGLAVPMVLAGVVGALPASAEPSPAQGPAARRVLVVAYPATTWERVEDADVPELRRLLARSAVASLSVRTIGPTTTAGEAYATIGAGNRVAVEDPTAGLALALGAPKQATTVAATYARRCGCDLGSSVAVHLAMPALNRRNDGLLYGAEAGLLATTLARAGHRMAAVGNADAGPAARGRDLHREVALASVDRQGRLAAGAVDGSLLAPADGGAFGVTLDAGAVVGAVAAAWEQADVVVLEMSDLARVELERPFATDAAFVANRARAMAAADRILGRVLEGVDLTRDRVLVLGPTGPVGSAQLTVAAYAGVGIEPGLARSATTRRDGHVTLPDVAPTILDAFGVELPDAMNGTPITSSGGRRPGPDAYADLARENEVTRFRDRATGPVSVAFILFQVVGYALAAVALSRWRRARPWVAGMALVTLAQPSLIFLSRLLPYDRLGLVGYVVALFAAGTVAAVTAMKVGCIVDRRIPGAATLLPPLLLIGSTLAVLLVDVLTGANLQLHTVLGYSPTIAGRFSGFGNLAFALLAAATFLVVSGTWGLVVASGRRLPLAAVVGVLVAVVLADGLPMFGSDVGGVLALVPASAVVVLLLADRRLDATKAALIGVGTVAVLAAFAAVDLSRPKEQRTHLGRLASRLLGDGGGVVTVIERKINANISILTSSVWTWVIPVAVAFLAFLLWRRNRFLAQAEAEVPGLRAGLYATLVAAVLGFALNDSGIAVPAMMLGVVLPYVSWLVLRTSAR